MDLSDPIYSYLDENWPTEADKLADQFINLLLDKGIDYEGCVDIFTARCYQRRDENDFVNALWKSVSNQ